MERAHEIFKIAIEAVTQTASTRIVLRTGCGGGLHVRSPAAIAADNAAFVDRDERRRRRRNERGRGPTRNVLRRRTIRRRRRPCPTKCQSNSRRPDLTDPRKDLTPAFVRGSFCTH